MVTAKRRPYGAPWHGAFAVCLVALLMSQEVLGLSPPGSAVVDSLGARALLQSDSANTTADTPAAEAAAAATNTLANVTATTNTTANASVPVGITSNASAAVGTTSNASVAANVSAAAGGPAAFAASTQDDVAGPLAGAFLPAVPHQEALSPEASLLSQLPALADMREWRATTRTLVVQPISQHSCCNAHECLAKCCARAHIGQTADVLMTWHGLS